MAARAGREDEASQKLVDRGRRKQTVGADVEGRVAASMATAVVIDGDCGGSDVVGDNGGPAHTRLPFVVHALNRRVHLNGRT